MFTSRAEHRLLLRIDNADLRLTARGRAAGLVGDERWQVFDGRRGRFERNLTAISEAERSGKSELRRAVRALRGPGADLDALVSRGELQLEIDPSAPEFDLASLVTTLRFGGYLKRQEWAVARRRTLEEHPIPVWFNYDGVAGLSREVVQRLGETRPETIGQASRIPGVTPAAVAVIAAHVARAAPRSQASS